MLGAALMLVGVVALQGCQSDYPNDWSDEKCIIAKASVLMDDGDGIGKYTVHCCEGEDDNGDPEGCRG
jgi:hypothetical protein